MNPIPQTVGVLSDTHGQHRSIPIPSVDILFHCGDVTLRGTGAELEDFLDWFGSLEVPNKVFIGGNHDWILEDLHRDGKAPTCPDRVHYLCQSRVRIGSLSIWGDPARPRPEWLLKAKPEKQAQRGTYAAFGVMPDDRLQSRWAQIPTGVDILLTHIPPWGVLDRGDPDPQGGRKSFGCGVLRSELVRVRPKLHLFGHIHSDTGRVQLDGTTFVNATQLDESYRLVRTPTVIQLGDP